MSVVTPVGASMPPRYWVLCKHGRVAVPIAHSDEEAVAWATARLTLLRVRGVFRDDRTVLYRNPKY